MEPEVIKRMQGRDEDREVRMIEKQEIFQSIVSTRQKELDDRHTERIHQLKQKHQSIEQEIADSFVN
jgi:hypothetical protein